MPSKSPKQERFMAGCAHGMKSDKCPPKRVAQEFNMADQRKDKKKKEKSEKPKPRTKTSPRALLGSGAAGKAMDKMNRKYAGYAEGGLVTKQGPVADWMTAGRKVRQGTNYKKQGKRGTR